MRRLGAFVGYTVLALVLWTMSLCGNMGVVHAVEVKELDLGEYQTEMTIGEKQLLSVTVLPITEEDEEVVFDSSNVSVATINGLGRITAHSEGMTVITASCGRVKANFHLSVKKKQDEKVAVTDLDLGDCPSELEVGSSQILGASVIPPNATEQDIIYTSSNPKVVSVNAIGRVTGEKVGKAKITLTCEGVQKSIWIKVVKKKNDVVAVTNLDIAEYEKKLEVDKTMTLSVTTFPTNATETTITYASSNKKIATVSPTGEIKGISQGKVTITVSCGKIKRKVKIQVIVPTAKISLNSNYLIMKPGQQYQLKATVMPEQASSNISFVSHSDEVFEVDKKGLITAKKCGNGNVIVSNGDTSVSVTVIVNQTGEETEKEKSYKKAKKEQSYPEVVLASEYPVISPEMLRYYYEENKKLTIVGEEYKIELEGSCIVNFDNPLYTDIDIAKTEKGLEFTVNNGKALCGEITLQWERNATYLYLYNSSEKKYERISMTSSKNMILDKEGKYLLADNKITSFRLNKGMLGGAVGGILLLGVVFVGVKRRYWFW